MVVDVDIPQLKVKFIVVFSYDFTCIYLEDEFTNNGESRFCNRNATFIELD